jgi:hypothetical protein
MGLVNGGMTHQDTHVIIMVVRKVVVMIVNHQQAVVTMMNIGIRTHALVRGYHE